MIESPDCGDSFGNKLRGSIREILPQPRYRTASRPASWGIVQGGLDEGVEKKVV